MNETPKVDDIVIWRAQRWQVVLVKAATPRKPPRLRMMRVVEVDATDVVPTGETWKPGGSR